MARIPITTRKVMSMIHPDSDEAKSEAIAEEFESGPTPEDRPEASSETDAVELSEADEAPMEESHPLLAENQSLRDQLLRVMADLENVRRRSRIDREEAAQYGAQDLLRDLVPVADNLDRALSAEGATAESLRQGVELTHRLMMEILRKHGLEEAPGVGAPFDPNLHEAVMRVEPTDEIPVGTIATEMQKGYVLRGRLIRPGMVTVAEVG